VGEVAKLGYERIESNEENEVDIVGGLNFNLFLDQASAPSRRLLTPLVESPFIVSYPLRGNYGPRHTIRGSDVAARSEYLVSSPQILTPNSDVGVA
jgi:hypothetical protein